MKKQNKTGIVNDISLNFVQRQNKSKIRHIAFQDLVKHRLFKFFKVQTQEINDIEFQRKKSSQ